MWLKRKRENRKLLGSCVWTERDCCKIVILGIKSEYLIVNIVGEYCSWRRKFLKRGYSEATVNVFISRFTSTLIGGRGKAGFRGLGLKRGRLWSHLTRNVPTLVTRIIDFEPVIFRTKVYCSTNWAIGRRFLRVAEYFRKQEAGWIVPNTISSTLSLVCSTKPRCSIYTLPTFIK